MGDLLQINLDIDKATAVQAAKQALSRRSLLHFILYVKDRRKQTYILGKHIVELCSRIDRALDDMFLYQKSSHIRVSIPFRHGKSEIISRFLTPYIIGKYGSPGLRAKNNPYNIELETILGSYSGDLSTALSRDSLNIIKSEEYREVFPEIQLSRTASSASDFETVIHPGHTARYPDLPDNLTLSKSRACGLGGGVTGRGASVLLIDDYLKNREEAESSTLREKQWESFTNDFMTRLAPVHIVIIVATRWHIDDVIGRIDSRNNPDSEHYDPEFPYFEPIVYKARDDAGNYLFPQRFSPAWYEQQFATLGPYSAAALLQSEPIAKGGNLLPTDKIRYLNSIDPQLLQRALPCRFWDLASSDVEQVKDDPDYTVGARGFCWFDEATPHMSDEGLLKRSYFFVTDVRIMQALAPTRNAHIVETAKGDGPLVWQGVEAQGGYKDAATVLKVLLKRLAIVHPITVHRNKFTRIESNLHPIVDAGRLVFLRGWWNSKASQQMAQFPSAEHDDIPDALASLWVMAFSRAKQALRAGYVGGAGLSSGRGLVQVTTQADQLDKSQGNMSIELEQELMTLEEIYADEHSTELG